MKTRSQSTEAQSTRNPRSAQRQPGPSEPDERNGGNVIQYREIAFTAYPVTDMTRARQFYEGVLGLKPNAPVKFDFKDDLCQDIPAWWHMKKKKTLYHTGTGHARSVRTMMAFALNPLNSASAIPKANPPPASPRAVLSRVLVSSMGGEGR